MRNPTDIQPMSTICGQEKVTQFTRKMIITQATRSLLCRFVVETVFPIENHFL